MLVFWEVAELQIEQLLQYICNSPTITISPTFNANCNFNIIVVSKRQGKNFLTHILDPFMKTCHTELTPRHP